MSVRIALWSAAALLATAIVGVARARAAAGRVLVWGASLAVCGVTVLSVLVPLLAAGGEAATLEPPLGIPCVGAWFRIDALAAFFLVVVNLGGAAARL